MLHWYQSVGFLFFLKRWVVQFMKEETIHKIQLNWSLWIELITSMNCRKRSSISWKEAKAMAQDTHEQVDVWTIDWRNDEASAEGTQGL